MSQFLNSKQIADKFGIPIRSLHAEVEAGRIPAIRIGKRYRFDPDAIAAFVKAGGVAIGESFSRKIETQNQTSSLPATI